MINIRQFKLFNLLETNLIFFNDTDKKKDEEGVNQPNKMLF